MRIALFSGNYNYLREGANQALNMLVGYLEERAGFTVRVYSPVTDTPAFEPAGTLVPVPSITLPVRSEFRLALGLNRALREDITRFRPDAIHVSTPDILGCRAQTFAKEAGVPIVASMHTRFETYLDYYGLGWARPVLDAHLRRFYRRCDHVLAPTMALVDELKEMRGDDRASVWSRGIDGDLFNPSRRDMDWRRAQGIGDEEVVVLFFGRLVIEKGIATFVAVVKALQERGLPVRPLVVGAGPAAGLFDPLANVVFTGHLMNAPLARAVASADVLLSPSTTETFGNVLVEAMASGLPVVSADAQNSRSILSHGEDGFLCPPDDIAAYVEAIGQLALSAHLRRAMSAAARRESMRYSWDAASESAAQAYRSLTCRGC
ncbi:Glycosyltransferase involved in cell wall bisynthesis [Novosphingobium sp. CF614]|uniref:glycosyltransferase family 4 protein n=1 Tax=Novosphingobium sp. CF614 TaxID=1884364 RepID=UPI0008E9487A|nr:glycosyltransferase family 1 protein [Novosphingobium sp. CF614]SFG14630.1 Glycosyltransferase involved in cell wall bisynthesis [Novosphingobium sp. CF614]